LFSFGPSAYNVNTSPVLQPIPGLPLCENGEEEVSGFNLWGEAITLSADECEFLNGERSINDADSVDMFLTLREKEFYTEPLARGSTPFNPVYYMVIQTSFASFA
jgi:hypothetical protein